MLKMIHIQEKFSDRLSSRRCLSGTVCVLALVALASTMTAGCLPVVVGGAAVVGTNLALEKRSLGDAVQDTSIRAQINQRWIAHDLDLAYRIELIVTEGRVLLTGRATNATMRADAVRLTWTVDGVKEVIDEIIIDPSTDLQQSTSDNWINARMRTLLIADTAIRQSNYSINTVNGVLYLIGTARTHEELDKVLAHARSIPNVKRVVSYLRV